jgi:hypothetical protein
MVELRSVEFRPSLKGANFFKLDMRRMSSISLPWDALHMAISSQRMNDPSVIRYIIHMCIINEISSNRPSPHAAPRGHAPHGMSWGAEGLRPEAILVQISWNHQSRLSVLCHVGEGNDSWQRDSWNKGREGLIFTIDF